MHVAWCVWHSVFRKQSPTGVSLQTLIGGQNRRKASLIRFKERPTKKHGPTFKTDAVLEVS
jgi:hypothetical protein